MKRVSQSITNYYLNVLLNNQVNCLLKVVRLKKVNQEFNDGIWVYHKFNKLVNESLASHA